MTAAPGEDQFSATLLDTLEQLGTPNISLKDEQTCSIREAFSRKDVFVFLPTGFGKSPCYQVLPFMFDHKAGLLGRNVMVVLSPLKAGPYLGGGATAPPDVFDLLQNSETNLQKYWAFKLALVVKSNIS